MKLSDFKLALDTHDLVLLKQSTPDQIFEWIKIGSITKREFKEWAVQYYLR